LYQGRKKRAGVKLNFCSSINCMRQNPFTRIPKIRKISSILCYYHKNRQSRLSKILSNSSFPYSCIHFKFKTITSAKFCVWEFYLDIFCVASIAIFHFSKWEMFRKICSGNQNTHYLINTCFSKRHTLYEMK
jgi:hypothetical protein